ncbi:hypothetical protein V8E54_007292, partial [Elaphomyces granulatus]
YAACNSYVMHEVKVVTSGYRLVLTYNLLHCPIDHITKLLYLVLHGWSLGSLNIELRLVATWLAMASSMCLNEQVPGVAKTLVSRC